MAERSIDHRGVQPAHTPLDWKGLLSGSSRLLALLLLLIGLSLASPYFFTVSNLLNTLRVASLVIIIALGEMVVVLIGGIDLSVGSILTVSAIAAAGLIKGETLGIPDLPYGIGMAAGLVTGMIFGLLNGLLVTRVKLPPFIATYGMMFVAGGTAIVLMGGYVIFDFQKDFRWWATGYVAGVPVPVLLMVGMAVLMHLFLSQTATGRAIYALGGNRSASRLVGINATRITILAYVISGFCTAFAAVLYVARLNAAEVAMGDFFLLPVIATVIIGGTSLSGGKGTVIDTIIGGLILAFINNALSLLGVSSFWQSFAMGSLILAAVLIDRLGKGVDIIPSGH